jgi:hypothetical protein
LISRPRRARRILAQQFAGAGLEVDALADQRHAIAAGAVDADVAVGVADVVHHQEADLARHVARGPAALGLGHHRIDRGQRRGHTGGLVRQAGFRAPPSPRGGRAAA